MPTTHLLYLHGFRSSPQSAKARTMAQYVQTQHPHVTWFCPQLPPSPQAAMQLVMAHVQDWPSAQMAVIGSALGGYYATWGAHQSFLVFTTFHLGARAARPQEACSTQSILSTSA